MKNEKLFVGGYYDDRVFEGERFEGKTPFDKTIDTYTLDEVLQLGFVENVKEWFEEQEGKEWDEASDQEKIKAILDYTDSDEIAGLVHFDTEQEVKEYKNETIKQIEENEKVSEYKEQIQDEYGYFREVYVLKK